jgi:hypothetical protein
MGEARAVALVRRMAPDHAEAILEVLGLAEPPREPPPVDVCRRGHPLTEANTKRAMRSDGYARRECLACKRDKYQGEITRPPATHCPKGHPWTPENTRTDVEGYRRCARCRSDYNREYKARRRAQRQEAR